MAPGTHPAKVSRVTNKTEPQPLSRMDKGGKTMQSRTRQNDITAELIIKKMD